LYFDNFSFPDNKFPHHKTGHYRNKSSQIWDPHPEYEIDAFGNRFHLKLNHDDEFIRHDIKVTVTFLNSNINDSFMENFAKIVQRKSHETH
jgi:hypothetical protein